MAMTTVSLNKIELRGCAPEPLMAYLKALGVFRIVAEQADQKARACWRSDDAFILHTSLDEDGLTRFFLEEYKPTPIVAPWNGGSGFYPKDNKDAMTAISDSDDTRLGIYRSVIASAQVVLENVQGAGSAKSSQQKEDILSACRNHLPDEALMWLDAAYVLTQDGPRYPPLLGTGGNDGRLDFSNNFMQNVLLAMGISGSQSRRRRTGPDSQELLAEALYDATNPALVKRAIGQFNPGGVGGPNSTAGFTGESLTNPWDFVLMIEGALLFAGAIARRLSAESRGRAVFPFTADTSAAGYGTAVDTEYTNDGSRAELWAPMWNRPATYQEITHLFGEGRAQLAGRQARTGTDFARAVVGLGVERGIHSFQRYGFLKRNGLAFIAAPLGRFYVRDDHKANILLDIDDWLDSLRRAARGQNAPEGLSRAIRRIDDAILEFCARGTARHLQEALIALGRAEAWLAKSNLKERIRPLPYPARQGLSPQWLDFCDDNTDSSREFRLAASLASIQAKEALGSIRTNLEPVTYKGYWDWADDDRSVVWYGGDPIEALAAVLERRCLEARMNSIGELPLYGVYSASLADIAAFLDRRTDDRRIADLLLPLTAIRWRDYTETREHPPAPISLPLAYVAMKLLFLTHDFKRRANAEAIPIRFEPSILPLLRSGRVDEAYKVASRRLWASGLRTLAEDAGFSDRDASRLAAALLFPIRYGDMYRLGEMALVQPDENSIYSI